MFNRPANGSVVRVTTRYRDPYLFAKSKWMDRVTEGTVLESNEYDPSGTFNVTTGRPEYPVSQIALRNIVALEVLQGPKATKKKDDNEVKVWKVTGSKGDKYTVTCFDGMWTCSCPHFTYRRADCRHIKDKQKEIKL